MLGRPCAFQAVDAGEGPLLISTEDYRDWRGTVAVGEDARPRLFAQKYTFVHTGAQEIGL